MDLRSQADEARELIFRIDLQGPKQEPDCQPLKPEGAPWGVIERVLAPFATVDAAYIRLIAVLGLLRGATFVSDPASVL